jgi:hypothetical protein
MASVFGFRSREPDLTFRCSGHRAKQGKAGKSAVESFRLEAIGELHPLAAHLFVPFAVTRLQERPEDTETVLAIELRGFQGETSAERALRLFWGKESIPQRPLAIQDNPLTEWAALGVACAVIWHYAGLRLHAVAAAGDRFDYWVWQETQEFGLEISGTLATDLEARRREKIQQLQANPYGSDGYVVVVGFTMRRVLFSFHHFEEGPP